nr:uncharacterized protein LOC109173497 [Ipomoea trifida]
MSVPRPRGEKTLKCTVWNEHVVAMLPFYNADLKEPLIVVLQLCRAKVVNGEVRITSSYDATKLHFNSSFDEFIESKSKLLSAIHSPVRNMSTATDGDFYVAAEILGIEGSGRWYYIFCITAVMRILNGVALIEQHVPELLQGRDKDLSSKPELDLIEDDLWDDERGE